MKFVFISNYFNHHQKPLSDALWSLSEVEYWFIETVQMDTERRKLGWNAENNEPYLLRYYEDSALCDRLLLEADVVIEGSVKDDLLKKRRSSSRVILRYSERQLREDASLPRRLWWYLKWHKRYSPRKPVYLLSTGAFAYTDYESYGIFRDRAFKWGYFPETKSYDADKLIKAKNKRLILWVGRFLPLKHPDDALSAVRRLKEDGSEFSLRFIGMGEMEAFLKKEIKRMELDDRVSVVGALPTEQVRKQMEQAGVLLFTSDKREGWGAVLNEAMNSACAVIASDAVGSVPYLIKHGENGLVYSSGDADMLYERIKLLLDAPDEQSRLGKNAYETIVTEWNAKNAAKRLVVLAEQATQGRLNRDTFASGPCSAAEIIKEDWFDGC